jgi:hypothetical protein
MRILALAIIVLPICCFAQKLENLKAEVAGDKIIITYDITGSQPDDSYNISLYSSQDKYASPLTQVTGDVGKKIKEGKNKRIEWDAPSEFNGVKGTLLFEVHAELVAKLTLQNSIDHARRGKVAPITWRGGDQHTPLKIELVKDNVVMGVIGTIRDKRTFDWKIPARQKTGKNYHLRLTNGRESVNSKAFSIQPKVPLLAKVVPVAGVGIAVFLLLSGDKGPTELATPPDLGLN